MVVVLVLVVVLYPKPNMQETDAPSTGACDCTKHLVLGWEYVRVYIPYVNDASR